VQWQQNQGAFVFRAVVAVSPSAMEHVFPVVCFCIARQMLPVCLYVNAQEPDKECRFSARRRLSPLVTQSRWPVRTGQWSRLSHGNASLVWHRSCYRSNRQPVWDPRGSLPQIPASPEEAPGFGKLAHVA
jgi:hypothetical protein